MKSIDKLRKNLRQYANPEKAKFFPRFFKTDPGEYGEGDKFIGVTVPNMRKIAKQYSTSSFLDIETLLCSPIHEERQVAIIILTYKFAKADEKLKKRIYDFYLSHTKQVNNWDLVDSSADKIVGGYLLDKKDKTILTKLASSKNLWEKRIAMIATYQLIKKRKNTKTHLK
jgi:3-methyladenine DNA glycosylase AlkD